MNFGITQIVQRALLATALLGAAAGLGAREVPAFVQGPLFSPNAAAVESVESSLKTDFVILSGGVDAGFQAGMLCRVVRGNNAIGEIIIVQVTRSQAAALILDLAPSQSIQAGDIARLKTL